MARREYVKFVKTRIAQGYRGDFYELKDQRFLGSDEFVEKIHRNRKEKSFSVYEISIDEIISSAGSMLKISEDLFYSRTQNRLEAWRRVVAAYLGKRLGGYQFKAIAEYFNRDPVVISQGVKKVEQRLMIDKGFAHEMNSLGESLIGNRKFKILN